MNVDKSAPAEITMAAARNGAKCETCSHSVPPTVGPMTSPSPCNAATTPSVAPRELNGIRSIRAAPRWARSEEHTSELQSRGHLVCRLLLEKKKSTQQKS